MRGEIYRLRPPRNATGQEQGSRYAVVVQSSALPLSTWLVAPTSTSARPATFRPEIDLNGQPTKVLVEQTTAIDPERLGDLVDTLALHEMNAVDAALRIVLDL
ncbi:type II toxin-antitoxin system PemK/MazF family toxin [Saccharothrix sp. NRRL B-16314]|uniref:type II toxin-antitoxin system PemK/MazF family toxin n=1 Tax=Saccharothrix sp. NRRL B-16314 TaxID=1463825 RepID=UPI0005268B43|nr:type II toxin-antitoxin system PemK/MazF family toxin [Saccharothrix sp. NRRL B-16314]